MRRSIIAAVGAVVFLGPLAVPVKELCGGEGKTCATAPDNEGYVHYYYETQPYLTPLIYDLTGRSVPLAYSRGIELRKSR